ncbi:hypothetical protein PG994_015343 [Apiospora phragmitis]|uniref:DNA/RNA-binding domain-containing protein n=1 Tax=Apiospora phragmitis TaxID=2905665 RepID=A0ABR1SSM2_9PEZI
MPRTNNVKEDVGFPGLVLCLFQISLFTQHPSTFSSTLPNKPFLHPQMATKADFNKVFPIGTMKATTASKEMLLYVIWPKETWEKEIKEVSKRLGIDVEVQDLERVVACFAEVTAVWDGASVGQLRGRYASGAGTRDARWLDPVEDADAPPSRRHSPSLEWAELGPVSPVQVSARAHRTRCCVGYFAPPWGLTESRGGTSRRYATVLPSSPPGGEPHRPQEPHPTSSKVFLLPSIRRMWKHGIHAFLELLRHRLPASLEHMLTFIYLAYSMMALLYETVPAFEATWMECLGDLGRYRMAIEDDDIRDREVWTAVSRRWYSKASDVVPRTGRLYHHLAILARPNVLQQLCFYSKALSAPDPFYAVRESIMTLFDPLLGSTSQHSRLLPIDSAYVKAHGLLFTGKTGSEYETAVAEFVNNLDNHISRTTRRWMECGYFIAISNCWALLSWGNNSFIYQTIRPRAVGNKETVEEYKNRTIPDPNAHENAKALEKARHLAEGTYSKVFPRILPVYDFISLGYGISGGDVPWKMVSMLLNSLLLSCRDFERIQSSEFPRQVEQLPRPLPEDFALRGLLWTEKYFPSGWFSNDKIDDDEKYFEVASMTDERKERILWLAVRIARQGKGKWLIYDAKFHQFSVPSRFEQEVDIDMKVDTKMATFQGADTLSRASTLALSSSGDKAIGEAEKDEDMPDMDDFMTEQPIIRQ